LEGAFAALRLELWRLADAVAGDFPSPAEVLAAGLALLRVVLRRVDPSL
jgi:hypothetical protein